MTDPLKTQKDAKSLNEKIKAELIKTMATKKVDRQAFRKMMKEHDWNYLPEGFASDELSDGEWLNILKSIHEDITLWASPSFTSGINAMQKGDLVELNLDMLDEDD